ncbi:uncharacterized protein LOC112688709 isoform X1 [Sipha flava]|uniref:Uncharacterized protein LOC112688709 isoform X1 n=1 Tax=Sipha flava TaxID=143950 RepID=A0A2S2QU04_9HEMI|nr:uncharacterized protein LOC112688709 isoform X1 [Sipha flava]
MHYLVGHDRSLMILLLVAFILRTCSPADDDSATSPAAADKPPAEAPGAGTDGASEGGIGSAISKYKSDMKDFGSEVVTATGELMKAISCATVATSRFLVAVWNGVSQTTAKTGETVATGYQMANRLTSKLPMIGTITTGGEHLLLATTSTFSENAASNSERRKKMVNDLYSKVDSFRPSSASATAAEAPSTAPAADAKPDADAPPDANAPPAR